MGKGSGTGVFGGTFNPVHLAHLRVAEEVVENLGLERMVFVPSARPPHKTTADSDPIAPASARLEWLRKAVSSNPRFEVDAVELEREGPSYLVDTLRSVGAKIAPELPVFALGCDAFLCSHREHPRVRREPAHDLHNVFGLKLPKIEEVATPQGIRSRLVADLETSTAHLLPDRQEAQMRFDVGGVLVSERRRSPEVGA